MPTIEANQVDEMAWQKANVKSRVEVEYTAT
jgi:hypothetical protein